MNVGTVMYNRKEMPKKHFLENRKKAKKYQANGITSRPSNGRTSVISFS